MLTEALTATDCVGPDKLRRADALPVEWAIDDGLVDYPTTLATMKTRAAAIAAGTAPELVWLVEHPPLYTSGTSASLSDLLDANRFPVYDAGRGGEYTYHGPGQRVAYLMLDLRARGRDVRVTLKSGAVSVLDGPVGLEEGKVHDHERDGRDDRDLRTEEHVDEPRRTADGLEELPHRGRGQQPPIPAVLRAEPAPGAEVLVPGLQVGFSLRPEQSDKPRQSQLSKLRYGRAQLSAYVRRAGPVAQLPHPLAGQRLGCVCVCFVVLAGLGVAGHEDRPHGHRRHIDQRRSVRRIKQTAVIKSELVSAEGRRNYTYADRG